MSNHIIDGEFQSDKYPTTPRGKVPLSVKDPTAQDLLWEYAQRRRSVDAEFSDDLQTALVAAGYLPAARDAERVRSVVSEAVKSWVANHTPSATDAERMVLGEVMATAIATRAADRLAGPLPVRPSADHVLRIVRDAFDAEWRNVVHVRANVEIPAASTVGWPLADAVAARVAEQLAGAVSEQRDMDVACYAEVKRERDSALSECKRLQSQLAGAGGGLSAEERDVVLKMRLMVPSDHLTPAQKMVLDRLLA